MSYTKSVHGATYQVPDSEFKAICARIGATRWCKPMPRRRSRYIYLVACPRCRALYWRRS